MRAVWIATVTNIDWPSTRNLTVEQQKQEMIDMLDSLQSLNFNTVVFQVRPAADAFYVSEIEPWSMWLTGKQGKRPEPFYDPLQFVIEQAHARCMDVHVWLNPYRAVISEADSVVAEHPVCQMKNLMKSYGGKCYFDPGYKETRDYLNKIVADIVARYDIDAIHFDDYFYAYREKNKEFPDNDTFEKEPRGFTPTQKDDWRRDNVNLVIAQLQQTIKSIKPWVEFGISPFGIWRNSYKDCRGSNTCSGMSNYDDLYADILKWMKDGSIDYVVPQLYWEIGKEVADYKILVDWWSKNTYGCNLYTGLYASGLSSNSKIPAWRKGNEIARQMKLNKKYPEQQGVFFFSARPFLKNPLGICDTLKNNYFKYPALVPVNSNIMGEPSAQPVGLKLVKDKEGAILSWNKVNENDGKQVSYYVVYAFPGKEIGDINNPQNIISKTTDSYLDLSSVCQKFKGNYVFVVTSVNKYKQESDVKDFIVRDFN